MLVTHNLRLIEQFADAAALARWGTRTRAGCSDEVTETYCALASSFADAAPFLA